MNKQQFVTHILENQSLVPQKKQGIAYAPSNIALVKYWGKRNEELNLPVTSSLSISLGNKGTTTKISRSETNFDQFFLNDMAVPPEHPAYVRLSKFLDLFRHDAQTKFEIHSSLNIPIAAGLASSASGFAALILALADFFQWTLDKKQLSLIARIGSGSACRSLWQGFVEWHIGTDNNGFDSFAEPIAIDWPEFRIGLLIFNDEEKQVSSRAAMQRTINTSIFYKLWPEKVAADLSTIKKALSEKDFSIVGATAESNALTMHALMQTATPAIVYSTPETIKTMQHIWQLRQQGLNIYFTQDAGPNLKLLFLEKDKNEVQKQFTNIDIV